MNYNLLLETAVLAGEIMLKNGAETYRVEDTINRMLNTSQLENVDSFVVTTGIVASISGRETHAMTVVKRVNQRENHLDKVCLVNEISRKLCAGKITVEEANKTLKEIENQVQYKPFLRDICIVITAVFFVILLGGSIKDGMVALVNGIVLSLILKFGSKIKMTSFILDAFASMVIAFLTIIITRIVVFDANIDLIIVGSIIALFPGVALTNAIRDTLSGDYASGGARMVEAVVKAVSIALGVGIGIGVMQIIVGGVLL